MHQFTLESSSWMNSIKSKEKKTVCANGNENRWKIQYVNTVFKISLFWCVPSRWTSTVTHFVLQVDVCTGIHSDPHGQNLHNCPCGNHEFFFCLVICWKKINNSLGQ